MSSLLNLKRKARFRSKSMFSGNHNSSDNEKSGDHRVSVPIDRRGSDSMASRSRTRQQDSSSCPASHEISSSDSSTDSGMFTRSSLESSACVSPNEENALADDKDENVLADEQDGLSQIFSGRLTFSENPSSPVDSKDFLKYEVPCDGPAALMTYISFEIISAEVIKDGRSGHVNYTILINPHKDSAKISPTVIKRRYSDFESLHHNLKKKFPSVMSQLSFPRKVLLGNFTSETIAKRSTAFEQYLTHLYSFFEVRYSRDFMEFFIHDDLHMAMDFFQENKYSNSIPLLEKVVPVLEKLYGNLHSLVCQCLCCLVVCYLELDKLAIAHSCAQVTLKCCLPQSSAADDELRCAIISTAIRLCWKLGVDKRDLELKLEAMHSQGICTDKTFDLKDVLLKTFQTPRPM